jgi:hypothetical protein
LAPRVGDTYYLMARLKFSNSGIAGLERQWN